MGCNVDIIDFGSLSNGLPTITESFCKWLVETSAFCLHYNSHNSTNCILECVNNIDGINKFKLIWQELDERIIDTYGDLEEVTEYGATGIAILLSIAMTNFTTVSRSFKKNGFDYWLGDKENTLFQGKARLEISGILRGNGTQFNSRIKQKFKQTNISDGSGLDCFVSVVEFSTPKASFLSKEKTYGKN
jgi:hypothetical protein